MPTSRSARLTGLLAAATILATTLAGCSRPTDTPADASAAQASTATGGTLNILTAGTELDLDPAKSQNLATTTLGLIARRLTTWEVRPQGDTTVVPDLATDTGTPSDNGRTWTYTLKDGILFEDGTPITSKDIKYGIERSFADSLTGGLSYHKTLLKGAENYQGPFDGKELDSIETPDDKTIVFRLNAPSGDWPWIVSQPAFSPVPNGKGTDPQYGHQPVSSGPYRVESNDQGSQAVLARNEHWDRATDSVRTAGPDRIVFRMSQDPSVAAQSIITGAGDAADSFLTGFVPPAQIAQAQADPNAKDLLVTSGDGAVEYLAINTRRVTDLKVRQAIQYATNKQAYQTASGGEIAGGFATTLITPGIPGRQAYDLYPADPSGDVDKAKSLITESGKPAPTLTLIARSDSADVASSIKTGLERAGFTVTIRTLDSEVYSDALTGDKGDYDLAISSWQPDFPSATANIAPLFDSSQIGHGNYNLSRYDNPEVDALIRQATETIDQTAAQQIWAQADRRILEDSPVVPLIYSHNTFIHGANVENFFIGNFPAYPNYLKVSLRAR